MYVFSLALDCLASPLLLSWENCDCYPFLLKKYLKKYHLSF